MRLRIVSFAFFCTSAVSALYVPSVNNTGPIVKLPYAQYQGFRNTSTGLGVFLGIKYAKAPVGKYTLAQFSLLETPIVTKATYAGGPHKLLVQYRGQSKQHLSQRDVFK